ncbi:galactoside O-acetyltransferase [bacterium]|nr:galactoside O-acetyltransferase [bacterium]
MKRLFLTVLRGYFYKLFFLRSCGPISVSSGCTIIGPKNNLIFGQKCKLEENVLLQAISEEPLKFGDNVTICFGALIRPSGFWGRNLGKGLSMGNNSSIGAYSYIGCSGKVQIGNQVLIGPNVSIIAENHIFDSLDIPIQNQGVSNKGIVIEDNVWIGTKSVILDGVKIGYGSIVAAGSVVTKNIPSNVIVAGTPAKIIRQRDTNDFR